MLGLFVSASMARSLLTKVATHLLTHRVKPLRLHQVPSLCRLAALLGALLVLAWPKAQAAGLYTQLMLNLGTERPFHYQYFKRENALVVAIEKTSPSELKALDHYDERLIKRILIKDLGPAGTELRIVFRDRRVRTTVYKLTEPFRIAIDLYDADYTPEKDPKTGLPLVEHKMNSEGMATQADGQGAGLAGYDAGPADHGKLLNPDTSTAHGSPLAAATPAETESKGPRGNKRLLISPIPDYTDNPEALSAALKETADGIGKGWASFPPYVYRLQTAAYEVGLSDAREPVITVPVLSTVKALADYAGKLYNTGHENKALIVYHQVLHREIGRAHV